MLNALLPPGPIWTPEEEAHLDQLLEGIADNYEDIRELLANLADIRNPHKTIILDDLEREYGIATNFLLSEATRRLRLAGLVYSKQGNGTEDDLQNALRAVGFDVYVYQNDPPVDPAIFLEQAFQMVAAGGNAYAGRADAFAGRLGGELLVNGSIFSTSRIFTSVAGTLYAGAGHGAGEYEDLLIEKIEYPIPTDPSDWPFVFFVGGAVTYGSPEIIINGDFETGDFTGFLFQFFSVIDNTNPATGTYCSKLVGFSPIIRRSPGAQTISYDISSSAIYTLKVKNDVPVYVSGNYRNAIEFRDASDNFISEEIFVDITAATAGYQQTIKTIGAPGSGADIILPAGAEKIRIQHLWDNIHNGTGYIDDIELSRTDRQSIIEIENATIDGTREDEFKRIILQYKPLHSWAALIVTFS
jgi:hypothetical protein